MIVDFESAEPLPSFEADVCVVGAGAAGIVLASELVRQGRRVLLLESGGLRMEPASQQLNECVYTGQPLEAAHRSRFRALGGATTVWGGQVLELAAEDFTARPWVPGSGWPFPKAALRRYYDRAVVAEGLGESYQQDDAIWSRLNMHAPDLGHELEPYFTRWCPRPNFAQLFRRHLESQQLCVVLHATACGFRFDESGTRIAGVSCKSLGGREHTFFAGQYALCLGTIESIRFLMQPMEGNRTPRWNRSGLLGRYFQSHIDWNAARIPADAASRLRPMFANVYLGGYKYHPKFRLSAEVQKQQQILGIAGAVTCINSAETELRQVKRLIRNPRQRRAISLQWADFPRTLRQLPTMLQLGYGYRVQHRAWWPRQSSFWLRVHCEQEPASQSRITLANERDATGMLQAQVDWHVSPLEWKTIQTFTHIVASEFRSRGLAKIEPQPELKDDEGFRDVRFDSSHHHMGGTRMAQSDAEGVVDPNLKLHGISNVYVCSASVFPSSGFSNPTHTLVALAIRLADHLASAIKSSAHA